MDEIHFYLDEEALIKAIAKLRESSGELGELVAVMELIDDAEIVESFAYPDFYSLRVAEQEVAQLLFHEDMNGKTRDLILRLQTVISKATPCAEETDIGFGCGALRNAGGGGLIGSTDFVQSAWWNSATMQSISKCDQFEAVIRHLFVALGLPERMFPPFALLMFKNIYFYSPPNNIRNLGLKYDDYIDRIVSHLSYLSDFAGEDFRSSVENNVRIAKAASRDVTISPDSPKTHKNKQAMKERDIEIGGITISCEWHTKFEAQVGRIHFYPLKHIDEKVNGTVGSKVIVGIFADHLTV